MHGDPYLAESNGYANGHAHGATMGWNRAIAQSQVVVDNLRGNLDAVSADYDQLQNAYLQLQAENEQLRETAGAQSAYISELKRGYAETLVAYAGLSGFAIPAIRYLSNMDPADGNKLVGSYLTTSKKLFENGKLGATFVHPHKNLRLAKDLPMLAEFIEKIDRDEQLSQRI